MGIPHSSTQLGDLSGFMLAGRLPRLEQDLGRAPLGAIPLRAPGKWFWPSSVPLPSPPPRDPCQDQGIELGWSPAPITGFHAGGPGLSEVAPAGDRTSPFFPGQMSGNCKVSSQEKPAIIINECRFWEPALTRTGPGGIDHGRVQVEKQNPRIMTVSEVAAYLRIPRSSVYRLAQEGRIPCQKVGRHWRFHREVMERWLGNDIRSQTVADG
jgi:excisionase family DNA binding protein